MAAKVIEMPARPSGRGLQAGQALGLSAARCGVCGGSGVLMRSGLTEPCRCVLRGVFRACFRRWQEIQSDHRRNVKGWRRIEEDFCADFELVARRHLSAEDWRLFEMQALQGRDYRYCCAALGLPKCVFFRRVYRIQQDLGGVFMGLRPYALYPLHEYFGPLRRAVEAAALPVAAPRRLADAYPLHCAA